MFIDPSIEDITSFIRKIYKMTNLDNYDELFYLKWNNFQKNVSTQFEQLRGEDVSINIQFYVISK